MRIGTWNLDARWDGRHERLIQRQECDVWLFTEVDEQLTLDGYVCHTTVERMERGQFWAAVASRLPLTPLADPHPASAMAEVDGLTFCSSILPWRSCGGQPPWRGTRSAEWTRGALDDLLLTLKPSRLVWGGDWNHALVGAETAGSMKGRGYILDAVAHLGLQVPTASLPHRIPSLLSIDHIAVSQEATVRKAERVDASVDGVRLSDHDLYIAEVDE